MNSMHLFPSIDLRGGKVVRLLRGEYDQQTTYDTDPLSQALAYQQAGSSWLHLVDLDGARSGQIAHLDAISALCRNTKLKVEVGGGVRSSSTIDLLLAAGVHRVILGTAALENWDWFAGLMGNPTYSGKIVLGLDARNGKLAVAGWEKESPRTALEVAQEVSDWPLAAIVYTDIATDGTLKGPNIQATALIARSTHVPVVASGGVGTLDHLHALRQLPLQGVIVGRAIYERAFTVRQALDIIEGPIGSHDR